MSGFAVLVEFRLKPGMRPAFRRLVDANARASARNEEACRRFDVLEPESQADCILLYELYDDQAAFQAHLTSDHYRSFAEASANLCAGKTVTTCDLVSEGGA